MIPALEIFKKSLEHHCYAIIMEKDPNYSKRIYAKYNDYLTMNLNYSESLEKCFLLLENKYSKLAKLLGSLHEVRYAGKRLIEILTLLEGLPPTSQTDKITEPQWLKFCFDSFWYADFSFCEKVICFLNRLQRALSAFKNRGDFQIIIKHLNTMEECRKASKKGRDPIAHTQSIALGELQNEHFWQLLFAINYKADFQIDPIQIIDGYLYFYKEKLINQAFEAIQSNYDLATSIFSDLNSISLSSISTKGA